MSIFCVQIQPPVSVADDTHSPCFMFNAHVFLHASLYPVLAWGHASYKTISLSIAFNSFRSLESFPSFYPFLLFMLPFFRPLWSHHPHTMVNSDDDHCMYMFCKNQFCLHHHPQDRTHPQSFSNISPIQIPIFFCTVTISVNIIIIANISMDNWTW